MRVKFSRIGRIKYWILKHVFGIDVLELIFGKDFWRLSEEVRTDG